MKLSVIIMLLTLTVALGSCKEDVPADEKKELELVFSDSIYQFTGIAQETGTRLFVAYPRWSAIYRYGLAVAGATTQPYPTEAMNQWQPGQPGQDKWVCVQSVYIDDAETLWVLDPAAPMLKTVQNNGAKLVRINKTTNAIERTYSFVGVVPDTAYVNDVQVDTQRQFAYLTESKGGGLLVVNLATGAMRRVLSNHYSTKSDSAYKYIIDGRELVTEGRPVKINADGIALSPNRKWLYYKPLTDDKLYRIETTYLRDWSLSDTTLETKVEDLGRFAATDGMIFDENGNLYLGDPQNYSLLKLTPDLKLTTLIQDDRLIWPDSYCIVNGYLYISCSQIHKQPEYNEGINKRTSPYTVYRMKL